MDAAFWIELVGYAGSALVVVSMLMTSVVRLRVVNTVGSLIFMVYALIIGSYPTALMNLCLISINIFQLLRLFRDQKEYDLVDVDLRDGFTAHFLEKNLPDIRKWFPQFSAEHLSGDLALLVCCSSQPASLFIGKRTQPDTLEIVLDYATPVYRDTSAGRFLYGQLRQRGFKTLVFRGEAPGHVAYLAKTGYRETGEGVYVLNLETL